jgi:preprotein translocase subunit Sec61beta
MLELRLWGGVHDRNRQNRSVFDARALLSWDHGSLRMNPVVLVYMLMAVAVVVVLAVMTMANLSNECIVSRCRNQTRQLGCRFFC